MWWKCVWEYPIEECEVIVFRCDGGGNFCSQLYALQVGKITGKALFKVQTQTHIETLSEARKEAILLPMNNIWSWTFTESCMMSREAIKLSKVVVVESK